jgi:hypothetical protein
MFAEDISVFFREFSVPVTAALGDGPFAFRAIFDDADLASRFGGTDADITQPRLTCALADAARLSRGVTISSPEIPAPPSAYRVLEILPEGTGLAVVVLAPHEDIPPEAADLHAELLDDY